MEISPPQVPWTVQPYGPAPKRLRVKTHLAIAIARSCIGSGAHGRFYKVVDLVNRLEIETRNGRQGGLLLSI
jgi:hypothetical protein